jgi:hypothetical protein
MYLNPVMRIGNATWKTLIFTIYHIYVVAIKNDGKAILKKWCQKKKQQKGNIQQIITKWKYTNKTNIYI